MLVGDSYTFGCGCSDNPTTMTSFSKFCWGSLLAKQYPKFTVMNYSSPGVDNLTIATQAWKNLSDEPDIVMFCATSPSRIQINNPGNPGKDTHSVNASFDYRVNAWPGEDGKNFGIAVENYYKYLYNDITGNNYTISAILSVYACAQSLGSDFLWSVHTTSDEPLDSYGVLNQLESKKFQSISSMPFEKKEIAECRHPNDAGHYRYFLTVINPLIQRYL